MHNINNRRRARRIVTTGLAAVLASAGTAAVIAGVGITPASAATASSDTVTEAFRETIKPWDSVTIPSMCCPSGSWLIDQDLSPGRGVPRGVEGTGDSGWIGTTISAMDHEYVTVDGVGGTKLQYRPITGTTVPSVVQAVTQCRTDSG